MWGTFQDTPNFIGDSIPWDVSQVTQMNSIFANASKFTGSSLAEWNVAKVNSMQSMFKDTISLLSSGLRSWNIERVNDFTLAFAGSYLETLGCESSLLYVSWSTQNTVFATKYADWEGRCLCFCNYRDELLGALDVWFEQSPEAFMYNCSKLSLWHVDNVKNFSSVFENRIKFIGEGVEAFDVSQAVDMSRMFKNAVSFDNELISSWNTARVEHMDYIFKGATNFTHSLHSWDVSKVQDLGTAFQDSSISECGKFQMYSTWSSLDLEDAEWVFETPWKDLLCESIHCERVTSESSTLRQLVKVWNLNETYVRSKCNWLQDLSHLNISEITDMSYVFLNFTTTDVNISNWDTSSVTSLTGTFSNASCRSLFDEIPGWNVRIFLLLL